ncbi:hypothetical protein CJF42_22540 [Pseudoalteromonas sp. NBT06-2]|uniref:aldo/keto reductase n=1 Tax=Pseudoalteromonas sp. NBT06-2 TaxID=2025950 RepID=UPI000BA772BC|nr:aldo/keto reductase [Pseudoalteromonas sp. NBT06-2]PAJ72202.1 hypothetical protein CJF42_22540 [Pseudoalteromonas sp. NBT06-2]
MKLVLGTVQLGLDYGISNNQGQVTKSQASNILQTANEIGITTFDTAAAYGNSESLLGSLLPQNSKIISKLPPELKHTDNLNKEMLSSLQKLQKDEIYALMLHDADVLIQYPEISKKLQKIKLSGKIQKIGVSFYFPEQLEACLNMDLDIIQIPINILDQRFLASDLLKKVKQKGIEIHVRSAFLQGLLLMKTEGLSNYFNKFSILKQLETELSDKSINKLNACVGFVKSIKEIDALVVGCCHSSELIEIHQAFANAAPFDGSLYSSQDLNLIYPANWPQE